MRNVLAIFYYILSGQNSEIWFVTTIVVPFIAVIMLCILLSFTAYGRFINRAARAKKFIVRNGMITHENKDLFYDKCIKGLPYFFTSLYRSRTTNIMPCFEDVIKPLFKNTKKFLLAVFDMIWITFMSITLIVCLMEGAEGRMILFCALAPLPLIALNRTICVYLIYQYHTHAKTAFVKLFNIINEECNCRKIFAACQNKS